MRQTSCEDQKPGGYCPRKKSGSLLPLRVFAETDVRPEPKCASASRSTGWQTRTLAPR